MNGTLVCFHKSSVLQMDPTRLWLSLLASLMEEVAGVDWNRGFDFALCKNKSANKGDSYVKCILCEKKWLNERSRSISESW